MPAIIENKKFKDTDLGDIPAGAFNFVCPAEFANNEDDKNGLRLQFYDGSVNQHWYWGNFAFDMGSIKLARKKVGVFDSHNTSSRLGIGSKLSVDKVAVLTGEFLDNDLAADVKKDALAGFPFEASMSFDLNKAKIEYIKEGQSVQVNGNTLDGPGTYISNTFVKEVSICAFGALDNCTTEIFKENINSIRKGNQMPDNNDKKTEMTIESFQAEHSEIYTSVFNKGKADGEKAERDSFKELKDACGEGNLGIAVKCFEESKSTVEALQLCNEKLTAANLKLKEDAGKLPPKGTDPAKSEFNDDQQELTVDKNADETKLSDEQLTAKFEKSKDLQSEFTNDVKAYIAAVKHERDYGPIK